MYNVYICGYTQTHTYTYTHTYILLTKYLGILFNYNLISNCCQVLMAFINRTRVLAVLRHLKDVEGIVITTFIHNKET